MYVRQRQILKKRERNNINESRKMVKGATRLQPMANPS